MPHCKPLAGSHCTRQAAETVWRADSHWSAAGTAEASQAVSLCHVGGMPGRCSLAGGC
jgi:hypothetical protein